MVHDERENERIDDVGIHRPQSASIAVLTSSDCGQERDVRSESVTSVRKVQVPVDPEDLEDHGSLDRPCEASNREVELRDRIVIDRRQGRPDRENLRIHILLTEPT